MPDWRAHPAEHLVQQQRDEEHPLRVAQVRDREDRDARLALRRVQDLPMSSGSPSSQPRSPATPAGCSAHRQLEAILGGIERLEIQHADALHRRRLDLLIRPSDRRSLALPPRVSKMFDSRMCSRLLHRIGVDADQRQQAGGGGADALAQAARDHRRSAGGGAANDFRIEIGMPALLPGV